MPSDQGERPNKFTKFLGERIKSAREAAGISQEELAQKSYLRRATLSDIENGKTEPDTSTFALLAYVLKKPLAYFLPEYLYEEIKKEELEPLEQEILLHFRQIDAEELQELATSIIKEFARFDPSDMVERLWPSVEAMRNFEKEAREAQEQRRKKK
jgi:transcriptional regulator with XRE-family HTH domain